MVSMDQYLDTLQKIPRGWHAKASHNPAAPPAIKCIARGVFSADPLDIVRFYSRPRRIKMLQCLSVLYNFWRDNGWNDRVEEESGRG